MQMESSTSKPSYKNEIQIECKVHSQPIITTK